MQPDRYINPITEITPTFKEAKEQYGKYGHGFTFDDAKPTAINDLAKGNRTVVVGEPGIGKTELMKKLHDSLDVSGHATKLISLRSLDAVREVDSFVSMKSEKPKALLLDALDETPLSTFSSVLDKIRDVSNKHPDLAIYVSSDGDYASTVKFLNDEKNLRHSFPHPKK